MQQPLGTTPPVWRNLAEAEQGYQPSPFAPPADLGGSGLERREFMRLLGASLALAGVSGCGFQQPTEKILPYSKMPEHGASGDPLYFATTYCCGTRAVGVLAESHSGRPTKIEGNLQHPASHGATDAATQASVLSLYDTRRSQSVRHLGEIATWEAFLAALRTTLGELSPERGLRILTESTTSPTTARLLREITEQFPNARRHHYEPTHADEAYRAQQRAFGRAVQPVYRFEQADVVVSLDSDFLSGLDGGVRYARDFMSGRDLTGDRREMNRLYVAEASVSGTGAAADHRLPLRPTELVRVARALAARLGVSDGIANDAERNLSAATRSWVAAAADDLLKARGAGVVVVGDRQPWQVHWLAYRLNETLGNVGTTVRYVEPVEDTPADHASSIAELTADLEAGRVGALLIVGGNPVYTAPVDLNFGEKLRKPNVLTAHLSPYFDETSTACRWHVPAAHYLESWGDARTFDGTASLVQPLIAPLFSGKTADEFIFAATGNSSMSAYELVRETWQAERGDGFAELWTNALREGIIPDTAAAAVTVTAAAPPTEIWNEPNVAGAANSSAAKLEAVFAPDPTIGDGRHYGNSWLQELPKTWTRLTWSNAVLVSPATAKYLGVSSEDVVEVRAGDRTVTGPIWITPGHAADTVTLHLGYGRRLGQAWGEPHGFDAYKLRSREAMSTPASVTITPTGRSRKLACTQDHHSTAGRDIVRTLTFDEFVKRVESESSHHKDALSADKPHEERDDHHGHPTLYPDWEYKGAAWGMAIDLSKCLDCGACVVACQAENNIPVVGEEQVLNGREMHWLRIDRYFHGDQAEPEAMLADPKVLLEPMMCQHCEHAPCEVVCPVAATSHSSEGLNEMTYNRCVGTRYCSNNCPYKVRRFNFLEFNNPSSPLAALQPNPDVTVRSRGVMEKCTYCVQRINGARINASIEAAHTGEPMKIADGAVVTACQAACASQAIVFGDINDPNSRVSKIKADPRNYGVLEELGVRPRTTYLSHVSNPNPSYVAAGPDRANTTTDEAHK
jgi:Fe-S-cluster-containing dehydrogenase component/anaerobic selenocysteine-containing dehydrogenase